MYFQPIIEIFPKIATTYSRNITIEEADGQASNFTFLPAYCSDKKCDCRRAMVNVYKNMELKIPYAVLSFAWEKEHFYKKIFPTLPEPVLRDFIGPAVDKYQPHGESSDKLLLVLKEFLKEKSYVEALKIQYMMAKRHQKMKFPKGLFLNTMMPCPCASGKAFRICCGK